MQKKINTSLSKIATPIKSKGRFFSDDKTNFRSDFQRDRDRIIHSTALFFCEPKSVYRSPKTPGSGVRVLTGGTYQHFFLF